MVPQVQSQMVKQLHTVGESLDVHGGVAAESGGVVPESGGGAAGSGGLHGSLEEGGACQPTWTCVHFVN